MALEFIAGCVSAGAAGGLAVALMNPLDTLKVRFQVTTTSSSMRQFAAEIIAKEGLVGGLYAPGVAANFWGIGISSMGRVGCYPYVRDSLLRSVGATEKNASVMMAAGLLAGAAGYLASSPVFQIKTLAQAEAGLIVDGTLATGASAGKRPRFHGRSLLAGLATLRADRALWRGSGTLMVRGALLSAGMQVGYDGCKTFARKKRWLDDGPLLHGISACAGAFGACAFSTPADVVMTRFQAAGMNGANKYPTVAHCAADILKQDGPAAFYRGFTPFVVRLGPVFLLSLPLTEQIRRILGLGYL